MDSSWVVMPMYNESAVVGSVIKDLLRVFPNIVCIDDGSTDGSNDAARAEGAVVIQHPVNLGQGAALQTGIEYALQDPELGCVVTFDADGQHQVADAEAMAARVLADEADVILGSRFLDKRTKVPPLKRLVLRSAALELKLSTGLKLTDAHNGLRAFNHLVASHIDLRQNRMAHATELIRQIAALQPRWSEHRVEILYTPYSKSKGQPLLNAVNVLTDLFPR